MTQRLGGACQCDRCMKKTPSDGFYHASNADHARDAQIRDHLDYTLEQKLGHDPKRGNPALDDTIERQRSPEEIEALLTKTRLKYPKVFGREIPPSSDIEGR